jgi:hippurate hydrolase
MKMENQMMRGLEQLAANLASEFSGSSRAAAGNGIRWRSGAPQSVATPTWISAPRPKLRGKLVLTLSLLLALLLPSPPGRNGSPTAQAAEPKVGPVRDWARANLPDLLGLYRHFHTHPELSLMEKETAARFAAELRAAGLEVTTNVGGYGVVGILKNGTGPTVMVRTDLDALPVTENTGLPFASKVKVKDSSGVEVGVMHACGHDVHMTSILGATRYLAGHRADWNGTLVVIGQPAEERVLGAKAMLDDGLFTRFPRPDFALALHVDAALEAGKIGCRPGYALANSDSVDITLFGKGGHGAYPHTTVDPIVTAAQLILALQTIVSREIRPTEPAVVTVGSIHAGTKHNIIPDQCKLQLTIRSYSDEVREQTLKAIERKAKGIAFSAGAPEPEIQVTDGTPALYNDDGLTARVDAMFRANLGAENVTPAEQSMGGEDFSRYGRAGVKILMFRLGAVDAKRLRGYRELSQPPPSLHSAKFYPDAELVLETGVVSMSLAALELLQ